MFVDYTPAPPLGARRVGFECFASADLIEREFTCRFPSILPAESLSESDNSLQLADRLFVSVAARRVVKNQLADESLYIN
jgi:hypothetical protein